MTEEELVSPEEGQVQPKNLYRIDYYHPQIGNDYALAPGTNEKEAYEHFKSTHESEFKMLSIALDFRSGE